MFVQVFQGPVSDPAQVKTLFDRWVSELGHEPSMTERTPVCQG